MRTIPRSDEIDVLMTEDQTKLRDGAAIAAVAPVKG